ncbi:MAG: hypothetical protein QOF13_1289 [Solirubrobacterales bacterium]|jgi:hypothetical protein|nr:hypothetical protein [Solirubrobacterales bacterium]
MALAHVIGAIFALAFAFAELDRLVLVTALRFFPLFAAFAARAAIETPRFARYCLTFSGSLANAQETGSTLRNFFVNRLGKINRLTYAHLRRHIGCAAPSLG